MAVTCEKENKVCNFETEWVEYCETWIDSGNNT